MIKHNQDGAVNGMVLSLILAMLLLLAAISFGGWAYTSRQDYKDNVDQKISIARDAAKQEEAAAKTKQFAEEAKNPLKTYAGPAAYASLLVNYPKTWSGYVDDTGTGSSQVDGYFAPGVVPAATSPTSVFALRIQVVGQPYAQVLQTLAAQQQSGKVQIRAYSLPKLPKVVGVQVVGELPDQSNVTMIVLPLRSQTLQIWTQGTQYLSDFNNYILPNISFSP